MTALLNVGESLIPTDVHEDNHMKSLLPILLCSTLSFAEPVPAPPVPDLPDDPGELSGTQWHINQARKKADAYELVSTRQLECAAKRHALDLALTRRCSNWGSDGSDFKTRAKICDTEASAEIVACGLSLPESAVKRWLEDMRTRDVLLDQRHIAMGAANVGDVWVVVFLD